MVRRIKWGKIGAPRSQKRKKWLTKLRASRKGIVLKRKPGNSTRRRTISRKRGRR